MSETGDFISLEETRAPNAETKKSGRSVATDDGLDHKTLFVRSIPFEATSEELSDFFSQFAPVRHAVVVTDSENKSRGFGFVSFSLDDDTQAALQKSRKEKFKDRMLRIDIAKRRDRKPDAGNTVAPKTPNVASGKTDKVRPRLIVRNLPWSVREPEQLKKVFQRYGALTEVNIPRKKGGRMCGFAFVSFKKYSSAEKVVKESSGIKVDGREVAVDFAVDKSKWKEHLALSKEDESDDDEDEEPLEHESDEDEIDEDEDEDEEDEDEDENEELNDISKLEEQADDNSELDEDEEDEEEERKPQNKQESYSIFVRNIPYDATEDSLQEHFEQFGPVKYALPVLDKETGLAKGTAFVAFYKKETYDGVLAGAPEQAAASILIADDVSPLYVYEGRILSIAPTVDRESATRLQDKNTEKRKQLMGKAPGEKDRRNLFLLNEGRITTNSKLAALITQTDMILREKSYNLRAQQLNKNPTLHVSLTRLAVRNLPRALTAKALKQLGRKAVLEFAKGVKSGDRQPLSKEELNRSTKHREFIGELVDGVESKKTKKKGVVRQAKIIMEVKGSGEAGRSRGYGFIEFKDHRAALMALRWLNAHEVSKEEILGPLDKEEQAFVQLDDSKKRRLIVEFAIENAQVVKRRIEKVANARKGTDAESTDKKDGKRKREYTNDKDGKRKREYTKDDKDGEDGFKNKKQKKFKKNKGNMNKGPKQAAKPEPSKPQVSEDVKQIIAQKRKRKNSKK